VLAKRFSNTRVVRLEGGLGSQIIGFLEFLYLEKFTSMETFIDSHYFQESSLDGWDPRVSKWPWALSRYGIHLKDLKEFSGGFATKRLLSSVRTQDRALKYSWQQLASTFRERFPIEDEKVEKFANAIGLDLKEKYAVVHIRRGDYVQVASLLLDESDQITLVKQLGALLPSKVLVISDTVITNEVKQKFKVGSTQEFIFIDDANVDAGLLHDLMRLAKLVVASNSTFSFTAGILNETDALVLSPLNFAKREPTSSPDSLFRSSGDFFIHRPSKL